MFLILCGSRMETYQILLLKQTRIVLQCHQTRLNELLQETQDLILLEDSHSVSLARVLQILYLISSIH